jgi:hypothetical protein
LETLTPHFVLPTSGKITHIEVSNNLIVWAVDEPLVKGEKTDLPVGVVYLCNVNDMKPIPVHRSEDMPFTHSFGEIRSISVFFRDEAKILITGGGEGIVRIWRFDAATSKFDQISMLEGHIRAVTCILLQGRNEFPVCL